MARKVAHPEPGDLEYLNPEESESAAARVRPNCVRCKSEKFTYTSHMFASMPGVLIYCRDCGGVVCWAPKPGK